MVEVASVTEEEVVRSTEETIKLPMLTEGEGEGSAALLVRIPGAAADLRTGEGKAFTIKIILGETGSIPQSATEGGAGGRTTTEEEVVAGETSGECSTTAVATRTTPSTMGTIKTVTMVTTMMTVTIMDKEAIKMIIMTKEAIKKTTMVTRVTMTKAVMTWTWSRRMS